MNSNEADLLTHFTKATLNKCPAYQGLMGLQVAHPCAKSQKCQSAENRKSGSFRCDCLVPKVPLGPKVPTSLTLETFRRQQLGCTSICKTCLLDHAAPRSLSRRCPTSSLRGFRT